MAGAVNITFGALVSGFVSSVGQATASVSALSRELNGNLSASYAAADRSQRVYDRGLGRLADNMTSFGRQASLVSAGIALIGATSFSTYANINALQLGLENITGSAAGAKARFAELMPIVRLPGLGLEEAIKGDVRLQAVGFSALQAKNALLQFGNALALTGGGKFELDSVLTQLTQMGSKAKVLAEDLKPILTSSPAVAKAIKEMFGTVDSEQISAKLQAVGQGPQDFINNLILKLSELERVKGGPKNAIENFSDAIKLAQFQFGEAADKAFNLTGKIDALGSLAGRAASGFGNLSEGAQVAILGVVGVTAAIGPLALALGGLITLAPTVGNGFGAMKTALLALATPIGAVALAVTLAIGAFAVLGNAVQAYSANLETSANRNAIFAETNNKVSASIAGEQTKLESLLSVARDETISKKARYQAVTDLNNISPQYLGNLRLETINTALAVAQINQYTSALTLKAKVQTLSQQAADASIAADKAAAKSAKEFVDRSRFSPDVIAVNIKTSGIMKLDVTVDREAAFDALGKARKDAEVKRAQDAASIINTALKKAYTDAAKQNITVDAPKIKPFDYSKVDMGGSALKKTKDRLKELKDEIASGNLTGKDVSALQAEYDTLKASLDRATDSTKKHKAAHLEALPTLTTNERLLKELSVRLKELGDGAPDLLRTQVGALQQMVAEEKRAIAGAIDLGQKLDQIASSSQSLSRVNAILSSGGVSTPGLTGTSATLGLPGLSTFQMGTADRLREERIRLQTELGLFKTNLSEIPTFFGQLRDGLAAQGGNLFNATGEKIRESVGKLAEVLKAAKETMLNSSVDAFAGIGEGIARASTGLESGKSVLSGILKSVIDIVANYAITVGKAMLITAIPFLTNPLTAAIGTKQLLTGGALVLAGGIAKGLAATAFAQGGLVTGPVLGLVGEGRGTSRNNPELIMPVDRLKKFIKGTGGGTQVFIPDIMLEGSLIRIALNRSDDSAQYFR